MSFPGRDHAPRTGRACRLGSTAPLRAALAFVSLVVLLVGAGAVAPSAGARPKSQTTRTEAPAADAPRKVAPRGQIVRGDGPRDAAASRGTARGETPVGIEIPEIGVDAPVETLTTVDNKMQDPTGPEVVAWYDDTDDLGATGNAVFAGHLDYADVGPAVFANLNLLAKNDRVLVTDDDGDVHAYRVVSREIVDATTGPWGEVTATTRRPTLTLITCAGPWDDATGHYRDRLVVRAVRVGA